MRRDAQVAVAIVLADNTIIGWKLGRAKFRIGDTVRVGRITKTACIAQIYRDIHGGVRLDRIVGGFVSWNVKDLHKC